MDAFRFSISWSRVLPRKCFLYFLTFEVPHFPFDFSITELNSSDGRLSAGINEEGIQFYNNLIDELIKNSYDLLLFFNDSVSYYDPFKSRTRHGKFLNLPNFRKLCW